MDRFDAIANTLVAKIPADVVLPVDRALLESATATALVIVTAGLMAAAVTGLFAGRQAAGRVLGLTAVVAVLDGLWRTAQPVLADLDAGASASGLSAGMLLLLLPCGLVASCCSGLDSLLSGQEPAPEDVGRPAPDGQTA